MSARCARASRVASITCLAAALAASSLLVPLPLRPARAAQMPIVASVVPSSGPSYGNTSVAIAGDGFMRASAVWFGNTAAPYFRAESDELIIASSPAQAVGTTVPVRVSTPGGSSSPGEHDDAFFYVVGRWKRTVPLSACAGQPAEGSCGPRGRHTATLLPGGSVLIAGGDTNNGVALASVQIYDPTRAEWFAAAPMPSGRSRHTETLLPDGTVLVAGGGQRRPFRYDPVANAWSSADPQPFATRTGNTATLLDGPECATAPVPSHCGKVLVTGGANSLGPSAELYNSLTKGWTPTSEMLMPRSRHTATLLSNGKVLVAGGDALGNPGSVALAEVFDPATGLWEPAGPMLAARSDQTATRLPDGKVLVTGGRQSPKAPGDPALASTEVYDPSTRVWSAGPPLAAARSNHTATVLPDTRVLVAGGRGRGDESSIASSEIYDPRQTTPLWQSAGEMHDERNLHSAIALSNGAVVVMGDAGSSSGTAELWYGSPAAREPFVVALEPTTGPSSGGTAVKLEGDDLFSSDTQVTFGGAVATSLRFVSGTRAVAVSPPQGAASIVNVGVNTRHGTSRSASSTQYSYAPAGPSPSPGARPVDPAFGPPAGGTEVEIGGTALYPLTRVTFGGKPATILWSASNSVVAIAPPHAPGTVDVVVETPAGDTAAGTYTYSHPGGVWQPTGRLANGRYSHTATLLDGIACKRNDGAPPPAYCGKVLVTGGTTAFLRGNADTSLSSSELYDPSSGTWTTTGAMAEARFGHTATLLPDGKVLVVGGFQPRMGALATAEVYDPETGRWSTAGTLGDKRFAHTATFLDGPACKAPSPPARCGKVLVSGGTQTHGGRTPLASTELYDPALGTATDLPSAVAAWSRSGSLGTPRADHTATLLPNGKVLVAAGGVQESSEDTFVYPPTNSAEIYDPTSGTWSPTARLAIPRLAHTATLLGGQQCGGHCGKVLVVGGAISGYGREGSNQRPVFLASVEVFDPSTESWSALDSLHAARGGHGVATLADGTVLVAGAGMSFDVHTDLYRAKMSSERFNPSTGRWSYAGDMAASRGVATATIIDGPTCRKALPSPFCGKVLVAGGAGHYEGVEDGHWAGDTPPPRSSAELFTALPEVATVTPAKGPATGGTEVVIAGSTFAGATAVNFGGVPAAGFKIDSPERITAVAPPHPGGQVDVQVVTGAGPSATSKDGRFTFVDVPGAVTDLRAEPLSESEMKLTFTAPDDGTPLGPATSYVIKQSEGAISEAGFDAATALCNGKCTFTPGEFVTLTVDRLQSDTTYHYRLRALNEYDVAGQLSNAAVNTTLPAAAGDTCVPPASPRPGQLAYPGGQYSLAGAPSGTLFHSSSPLYGWLDRGAGGKYDVLPSGQGATAGHGYWVWFRCPTVVDLADGGAPSVRTPLAAYHASMVGNPSANGAASVSGHDFAAAWDPTVNDGAGGYRVSAYRQLQELRLGEGAWVFSYEDTVIKIDG